MNLTELDKSILVTIYRRGNKSKKAHFPIEFICKGYPRHIHGMVKRRVKRLAVEGYLYTKPHPSGKSYGLSENGWQIARKLDKELKNL